MADTLETHPFWLPRPACDVVIIAGPAGAGKSTYARAAALADDVVIDLDECFSEVCGVHGHTADRKFLVDALTLRNRKLEALSEKKSGVAYFVVSAPTHGERAWWANLLSARVVMLDVPFSTIRTREISTSRKLHAREWHEKKLLQWKPPAVPTKIGADGYPEEIDAR